VISLTTASVTVPDGELLRTIVMFGRTKEMDAGGKRMAAREREIIAPTEMRIAPPKRFAATSERDDGPVPEIV
jgi:hypothetical protein